MANTRRDVAKERRWRDRFKRHAASGLSVRKFCRREKLAESAFYAWRRIVAERDGDAMSRQRASAFVPLTVIERSGCEAFLEIALAGGRTLRLPPAITAQRLAEVVQALEGR